MWGPCRRMTPKGVTVNTRIARVAVGAAALAMAGSATVVLANHGEPHQGGSQDCLNTITGQKEGTFTWTGATSSWPPNHKAISAAITLTDDDAESATDNVTLAV